MTNNWLITLIFVLTILTILHIAYYLLMYTRTRRPAAAGIKNTPSSKLLDNAAMNNIKASKANNNSNATTTAPAADDKNVFYTQSDNFQKLEGVGPAIEETLKTAGIRTYKQLAESDYSTLKSILMSKGSKFVMHDPRNWPKQSKLAQEGKWEELDKLKEELIRGR
jgi:predicted flap endonuclease-1-like 5' DNA nuclease